MATQQLGIGIILIAFAAAVGLGAFHALEPGHGKTLVAAYLVGSRGTMKHAFLLGLIVTAAHTAGVYLLGGVTLYASRYIVPDRLYPWLGVVSGIMIAGLGLILLVRRYLGKDGFQVIITTIMRIISRPRRTLTIIITVTMATLTITATPTNTISTKECLAGNS